MRPTYPSLAPELIEVLARGELTFHATDPPRESRFIIVNAAHTGPVVATLAQINSIFSYARRRPESSSGSARAWARVAQLGLQFVARLNYFAVDAMTSAGTEPALNPAVAMETGASPTLKMGPYTAPDIRLINEVAGHVAAHGAGMAHSADSGLDSSLASDSPRVNSIPRTATDSVLEYLDAVADSTGSISTLKSSRANSLKAGTRVSRAFKSDDPTQHPSDRSESGSMSAGDTGSGNASNDEDRAVPARQPNSLIPRAAIHSGKYRRSQSTSRIRTDLMRRVEERASGQISISFRVELPPSHNNSAAELETEASCEAGNTQHLVARKGEIAHTQSDLMAALEGEVPFTLTAQIHSSARPGEIKDAEVVLLNSDHGYGLDARARVASELRRAGQRWEPLQLLGNGPTPDTLLLRTEELDNLLTEGAAKLTSVGFQVHWPKELSKHLRPSLSVSVRPPGSAKGQVREQDEAHSSSLFAGLGAFELKWQIALGDDQLTPEELDLIAESQRPIVRLRNEWVVLDSHVVAKARRRILRSITPLEAMESAMLGVLEAEGQSLEVLPDAQMLEYLNSLHRIGDLEFEGAAKITSPEGLHGQLRDYQLAGLRWLAALTARGLGAVLADDMGLGKTITVIALHLHRLESGLATLPHAGASAGFGLLALDDSSFIAGHRPTLIVCPASLLGNWEREIHRFAPGLPVRRYHGSKRSLADAALGGFILTTYGTMQRDAEALGEPPWGLVVADEAQHVKNPNAKAAKALRQLGAQSGCGRVALTGTPVENNLSELWALLDWTVPGLLGNLKYFRSVWAGPIERGSPDKDHDAEIVQRFKRIIAPFLLRRRKSDPGIAPELPPKVLTDQFVDLTREQVALYEATLREAMARIEEVDGIHRRGLILKLISGLKQICNHPHLFTRETSTGKFASRSGKVQLLDELIETITAEGQASLIFTQYARMGGLLLDHLTAQGVRAQFLSGATGIPQRQAMVDRFQRGDCSIFVLSLRAAGTGLNLTRAEHVIHFDRWWNPAVEEQASDRAYRIGQTKSVQVHRMICSGTLEERVAQVMSEKAGLADTILGAGPDSLTNLSNPDLRDLLTLRR